MERGHCAASSMRSVDGRALLLELALPDPGHVPGLRAVRLALDEVVGDEDELQHAVVDAADDGEAAVEAFDGARAELGLGLELAVARRRRADHVRDALDVDVQPAALDA